MWRTPVGFVALAARGESRFGAVAIECRSWLWARRIVAGSQEPLWVAGADLPRSAGHPFYERLNGILEAGGFDELVESECAQFAMRPSGWAVRRLCPGRYFRLLLVRLLRAVRLLDSERGIACACSGLSEHSSVPGVGRDRVGAGSFDHFAYASAGQTWRLTAECSRGCLVVWRSRVWCRARRLGVDATTLEANAALRSRIVRL